MKTPSRILIIRLSSLGDILHTLPAFINLKASFPDAQIDWLVAKKAKFLLSSVKGIHALHVLDTSLLLKMPPNKESWHQLRALIRALRARQYDLAIDFQGLLKSALLCALSGAKMRLGFSRELVRERPSHWFYEKTLAKPNSQIHITELNQLLAALSGASRVDSLIRQNQLENFVVLNPGGGWPTKIWSPERYGTLAEKIQSELHLQVVVTTGPGEEPLYKTIAENCRTAALYHFPVTFLQLIPLISKARLFVGGDTVVAIFGPTSPIRNGPWNAAEEVVTHRQNCAPCYGRSCHIGAECMNIPVDEVFAAIVRRLDNIKKETSFAHA
jgi:heptosyltransferase I